MTIFPSKDKPERPGEAWQRGRDTTADNDRFLREVRKMGERGRQLYAELTRDRDKK